MLKKILQTCEFTAKSIARSAEKLSAIDHIFGELANTIGKLPQSDLQGRLAGQVLKAQDLLDAQISEKKVEVQVSKDFVDAFRKKKVISPGVSRTLYVELFLQVLNNAPEDVSSKELLGQFITNMIAVQAAKTAQKARKIGRVHNDAKNVDVKETECPSFSKVCLQTIVDRNTKLTCLPPTTSSPSKIPTPIIQNAIRSRNKACAVPTQRTVPPNTTTTKMPAARSQCTTKPREEARREPVGNKIAAPGQRPTKVPAEPSKKSFPASKKSQPWKETVNTSSAPKIRSVFDTKEQADASPPSVYKAVTTKIRQVKGKFVSTKKTGAVVAQTKQQISNEDLHSLFRSPELDGEAIETVAGSGTGDRGDYMSLKTTGLPHVTELKASTEQHGETVSRENSTVGSQVGSSLRTSSHETLPTPEGSSSNEEDWTNSENSEGTKKISLKEYLKGKTTGGGSTPRDHSSQSHSSGQRKRKRIGDNGSSPYKKKPAIESYYVAHPQVCSSSLALCQSTADTSQTCRPTPDIHPDMMDVDTVPSPALFPAVHTSAFGPPAPVAR
jgi:hypothetical protein